MLSRLKAAGMRTAILPSNGARPRCCAARLSDAGIGHLLDAVLSVEEVGIYKPHPSVYQLAVDRLAVAPDQISFQSSNAWDAWAASAFGMRVVWCNRYAQPPERVPGKPDHEIRSLAELPRIGPAGQLKLVLGPTVWRRRSRQVSVRAALCAPQPTAHRPPPAVRRLARPM